MWRIVVIIIVSFPTLALGDDHISNNFSTSIFSIEIPEGMEIDESDNNHISLVFAKDPDLDLGTISISTKRHKNILDKEKAWKKIRSVILNGWTLLNEGEIEFADHKWKSIAMMHVTDCCKVRSNDFYTFFEKDTFCISYHCESSNCDKINDAFIQIASSLKIK